MSRCVWMKKQLPEKRKMKRGKIHAERQRLKTSQEQISSRAKRSCWRHRNQWSQEIVRWMYTRPPAHLPSSAGCVTQAVSKKGGWWLYTNRDCRITYASARTDGLSEQWPWSHWHISVSLYIWQNHCGQLPLPYWVMMNDYTCVNHERVIEFTAWIVICY